MNVFHPHCYESIQKERLNPLQMVRNMADRTGIAQHNGVDSSQLDIDVYGLTPTEVSRLNTTDNIGQVPIQLFRSKHPGKYDFGAPSSEPSLQYSRHELSDVSDVIGTVKFIYTKYLCVISVSGKHASISAVRAHSHWFRMGYQLFITWMNYKKIGI